MDFHKRWNEYDVHISKAREAECVDDAQNMGSLKIEMNALYRTGGRKEYYILCTFSYLEKYDCQTVLNAAKTSIKGNLFNRQRKNTEFFK